MSNPISPFPDSRSDKTTIVPSVSVSNADIYKPLSAPLFDYTKSLSNALSSTSSDPLSILLRQLQYWESEEKENFYLVAGSLANGSAIDIVTVITDIAINSSYCFKASINSLRFLSANNEECSQHVMNALIPFFLSKDSKVEPDDNEVLMLLATVGPFATESQAKDIMNIVGKNIAGKPDDLKALILRVYASISNYGEVFDENILLDYIVKHLNYPGEAPLDEDLVRPALIIVDSLLQQPGTCGYIKLFESMIFPKLLHALTCITGNTPSLQILILRVLLAALEEKPKKSDYNSYFMLEHCAILLELASSEWKPLATLAESTLERFNYTRLNCSK